MKNIITLKGYDEIIKLFSSLKIEKEHWVEEKRIAAEQGDRSENAEYISAKENIRNIDKKLYRLDFIINNTRAVDTTKRKKSDIVLFGSTVLVNKSSKQGDEEMLLKLVGTQELIYIQKVEKRENPNNFPLCLSNISPLGSQLFKKEVGDEIEIGEYIYELLEIIE